MKLLIVVGVNQFEKEIRSFIENAGIEIYSTSDITGHKDMRNENLSGNWFARSSSVEDSVMFFSFTDSDKAEAVIHSVKEFNANADSLSRIKAFILPVEKHT